jgi:hypothetical protein
MHGGGTRAGHPRIFTGKFDSVLPVGRNVYSIASAEKLELLKSMQGDAETQGEQRLLPCTSLFQSVPVAAAPAAAPASSPVPPALQPSESAVDKAPDRETTGSRQGPDLAGTPSIGQKGHETKEEPTVAMSKNPPKGTSNGTPRRSTHNAASPGSSTTTAANGMDGATTCAIST